jgi:hypothetical protein
MTTPDALFDIMVAEAVIMDPGWERRFAASAILASSRSGISPNEYFGLVQSLIMCVEIARLRMRVEELERELDRGSHI